MFLVLALLCFMHLSLANAWLLAPGMYYAARRTDRHMKLQATLSDCTPDPTPITRGKALQQLAIGVGSFSAGAAVFAEGSEGATEPKVTDKVYLDFKIAGEPAGRIVIGLFGKVAPETVDTFLKVTKEELRGPISYDGSLITRIEPSRIDLGRLPAGTDKYEVKKVDNTGRLRRTTKYYAEDYTTFDSNSLLHDRPGVISTIKGGGTFEFTMSVGATPNKELDKKNIVFGQILSGFDVVDKLLQVPTSKEDFLGSKQSFAAAGKGFDPRAKLASVNKPLVKVVVSKAGVL